MNYSQNSERPEVLLIHDVDVFKDSILNQSFRYDINITYPKK